MKTKQLFVALYEAEFFENRKQSHFNGSRVEEYTDKAYYRNETVPTNGNNGMSEGLTNTHEVNNIPNIPDIPNIPSECLECLEC